MWGALLTWGDEREGKAMAGGAGVPCLLPGAHRIVVNKQEPLSRFKVERWPECGCFRKHTCSGALSWAGRQRTLLLGG